MADGNPTPTNRPTRFRKGEAITERKLNNVVDAASRLSSGVRGPQQIFRRPGGAQDLTFDLADYVATTNVTLSGTGATIDGHTVAADDIILVTAQTTTTDNGIWVAASGAWGQQSPTFQPEMVGVALGSLDSLSLWMLVDTDTYAQVATGGTTIVLKTSTTNIGTLSGTQTVDGTTTAANRLVLLANQTTTTDNGVWRTSAGAWTFINQPAAAIATAGNNNAFATFLLSAANTYHIGVGGYG